jgi:hypothetical protein
MAADASATGRRRGRPRRFDGTPVSVRLPQPLHDALILEAIRRHVDLSDVIRERLSVNFVSQNSRVRESSAS